MISDKVCVLHEGRLLCSGTPLFLKEKFSSGHRMTVETAVATGITLTHYYVYCVATNGMVLLGQWATVTPVPTWLPFLYYMYFLSFETIFAIIS